MYMVWVYEVFRYTEFKITVHKSHIFERNYFSFGGVLFSAIVLFLSFLDNASVCSDKTINNSGSLNKKI